MADVSKFNVDGTEVNVKDATARQTLQSQGQTLQSQGQNINTLSADVSKLKTSIVNAVKASYTEENETISLTKIVL